MQILANIDFDGNCREAFTTYAEILGGNIRAMLSHNELPEVSEETDPARRERILHAWIDIGGSALMGQDMQDFSGRKGYSVTVVADTASDAERIFNALNRGGTPIIPFGAQPWSVAFGVTTDRFGVTWMIDTSETI
jgi:PhnB protein